MAKRARTIDEYLAGLEPGSRAALEKIRKAIRSAVPKAEECITYGMPGFRLDGRCFVAFRATAKHCSLHPMSGRTVAAHAKALAGYDTSPGTIRFPPSDPLPAALVRKLVKARLAEDAPPRPAKAPTTARPRARASARSSAKTRRA